MILAYTPRGTKRKSKVNLLEAAEKYLTNDRYDQRKSDMVAVAHKEKINKLHDEQGRKRAWLTVENKIYTNLASLFDKVLAQTEEMVAKNVNPLAPSPQKPHMISHGSRKRKKEVKGNVYA